jgi:O-antigen/teichoic acid export membrane protein
VTRARQLFSSIGAAYVRFAVTSACSLVAVPIYLHFLGKEQYGLWLTILSVLMPLSLTSIGFPTVSQNLLAEARVRDDWQAVNRILSTSFIFLCFAAVSACLLMAISLRLGMVERLLATSSGPVAAVIPALLIALAGFAFSQPLQVFRLAFRAFERVDLEQYGLAALAAVNLLLTALVLWAGWGIAGVASVYAFLQLAAGAIFFAALTRKFSCLRFSVRLFSLRLTRRMLPPGFHFFVVSVSGVLMWGIDNLVIAGVMGAAFVTAFAIASRLTSLLRGLIAMPFSTTAPTITALNAQGRQAQLRSLFFFSTRLAISAAVLFSIELAFFGRSFIRLWAGRAVVVDAATFMALVAVLAVNVLQQPAYAFIIATTRHRVFSRLSLLEGAANLALSWWWVHRWGVLGVALGTLVPHALISGVYLLREGARMNGFTFSELWRKNVWSLAFPATASVAAAFFLRNFSASWLEWTVSTGLTLLAFALTCWLASTTPEERGILAAALRAA